MTPTRLSRTFAHARLHVAAAALAVGLAFTARPALGQAAPARASGPARDSVVATVQEFFTAIETSDSTRAARTIHPDGGMFSFQPRGDSARLEYGPLSRFPLVLATNKRKLLERMWEPTVLVHGPMAVVWTAYDFHVDGVFSHCGIDAFTLTRTPAGWRIVNVTYTVERTGCAASPLGPVKKD